MTHGKNKSGTSGFNEVFERMMKKRRKAEPAPIQERNQYPGRGLYNRLTTESKSRWSKR